MKFAVDRDAALEAVTFVRGAVLRRSTIPVLGSILLKAADARVEFVGTDLDLEAAKTAPAEVETEGSFAIDAERLFGALQSLPAGCRVSVSTDAKAARAVIQFGRSRFQIPTIPGKDFPAFPEAADAAWAEVPSRDIERLLDATEFAAGREMTRLYIAGVHFHEVGDKWRAIGTDGAVLSYAEIDCPDGLRGGARASVPLKTISLLRVLAKVESAVEINLTESRFSARAPDARLTSKVIDAAYPDYQRIIPADAPGECRVDRMDFIAALKRCLAATEARAPAARIKIDATSMALAARGEFGEEAEDTLDASATAEFIASFNARYLLEIAGAFPTSELVIRYSEPTSPITIGSPNDPSSLAVLIGMRTN